MTTTNVQPAGVGALTLAALALSLGACGGGDGNDERSDTGPADPAPRPAKAPPSAPEPARCPAGSANCRSADGTILFVERVDPDGDGDAHFVLTSNESVTAPGISVIDVRPALRPDPLPAPGDRISA